MAWVSTIGAICYYILVPFKFLFNCLLVILSPVIHLGRIATSTLLLPVRLLAKLETILIYLGTATAIGIFAGGLLYVLSTLLVSVLNLNPSPEVKGRTAASVRAAREKRKFEEAWQNVVPKNEDGAWKSDGSMEKKYAEWLEQGGKGLKRERGILGQTILEEDDDSDIL